MGKTYEHLLSPIKVGNMVLVRPSPKLPDWSGMIDTPWSATSPIQISLYNAEYLLSIRCGDEKYLPLTGDPSEIISQLIDLANRREQMYITAGERDTLGLNINYTVDTRTYLEQILALAKKYGLELSTRYGFDTSRRLMIYIDIKRRIGDTYDYIFHDGASANVELRSAKVSGTILNCVTAKNNASTGQTVLYSNAQQNSTSISTYRLRSGIISVQNVNDINNLDTAAKNYLNLNYAPKLSLTVSAIDVGDTFNYLRLGNTIAMRLSTVHLPGGARGWRGTARIKAMSYDESTNRVDLNLEANL